MPAWPTTFLTCGTKIFSRKCTSSIHSEKPVVARRLSGISRGDWCSCGRWHCSCTSQARCLSGKRSTLGWHAIACDWPADATTAPANCRKPLRKQRLFAMPSEVEPGTGHAPAGHWTARSDCVTNAHQFLTPPSSNAHAVVPFFGPIRFFRMFA